MQLKERFLNAVMSGDLGRRDELGVTVELKEFKRYFNDVASGYVQAFLPTATIESGQYNMTPAKFLFRIKKGVYRIHPDLLYGKQDHRVDVKINNHCFATRISYV